METKLYKGTVKLNFDEAKHLYTVNNQRVLGVTSIIGILGKPALVNWATKLAVDKVRERKDFLSTHLEDVLMEAKREHWVQSQQAKELGTRVHAVADRWFSEDKLGLVQEMLKVKNEDERNSLSALMEFLKGKNKRKAGERKVYSKKHKYAGTADYVGDIDIYIDTVGDFKTSARIYPEYFLQAAAYAQALTEEGIPVKQTAIIRLGKDGKLEIKFDKNWKDKVPIFLALKKVYEWQLSLIDKSYEKD